MQTTTHQPKGSMCSNCGNASAQCKALPFASMPVVKTYTDGVKAVKCSNHAPEVGTELLPCLSCGGVHERLPDGTVIDGCGH